MSLPLPKKGWCPNTSYSESEVVIFSLNKPNWLKWKNYFIFQNTQFWFFGSLSADLESRLKPPCVLKKPLHFELFPFYIFFFKKVSQILWIIMNHTFGLIWYDSIIVASVLIDTKAYDIRKRQDWKSFSRKRRRYVNIL